MALSDPAVSGSSAHRLILRNMAWVAVFLLAGRVAGAGKEMAIAYRFGIGAELDAYLAAFTLITVPAAVWFSVLTAVLVPLSARLHADSAADLPRFRAELFGLALGLAGLIWIGLGLGLPLLLRANGTVLPGPVQAIAADVGTRLAVIAPLGILISLFSAWMLAAGRNANTLFEGIPALVIAIAVLVATESGWQVLVWSTVAGYGMQLFVLGTALGRTRELAPPQFAFASPSWRAFWSGFGITLVGQVLISLVGPIDQAFAAGQGTGAIATLGYADRLMALALGLGSLAVSRASLPVFARALAADPNGVAAHRAMVRLFWTMFALGALALAIGWVLAPIAVRLLFERGAFTPENTLAVTEVLRFGLLQLPLSFADFVLVSYVTSQRRYRVLFWSSIVVLVVKVASNSVLAPAFGIKGIALGWTVAMFACVLLFWYAIAKADAREPSR